MNRILPATASLYNAYEECLNMKKGMIWRKMIFYCYAVTDSPMLAAVKIWSMFSRKNPVLEIRHKNF